MESLEYGPIERAVLKHQGEEIAEAWFEAEGDRPILVCRVPRDTCSRLTLATILRAASISQDEVDSWRLQANPSSGLCDFDTPLPAPPADATHLTAFIHLKPPPTDGSSSPQETSLTTWQALDAGWKSILGLEASIDTARLSMDGLRGEMETAFKKPLAVEEKLHALQSDVAQWTKAKSRVHHALPKVREFVHRATWAVAVPERKRLEEIYRNHIEPRDPLPDMDKVREQIEHLLKDRQVLFAQGNAVYQECRGILGEIQRALSTLQKNAADNARRKRSASREKGKHI